MRCGKVFRQRGALVSLAVLAAGVAVFFAANLKAPFGVEGVPTEVAIYNQLVFQSWNEAGFAHCLGVPILGAVGVRVKDRHPYLHHPPLGFWPAYLGRQLLRRGVAGFRLPPLLAVSLTALLLWLMVLSVAGPLWAFMGGVLFLLAGIVQLYGAMPYSEPYVLVTACCLLLALRNWRAHPGRASLFWLVLIFLLGTQLEWDFYFMVPGLLVAEFLLPKGERRWKPLLVLVPLGVAGFLLVLSHMALAAGSLREVVQSILTAAGATQNLLQGGEVYAPFGGFLASQAHLLVQDYGLPWLLALPPILLAALLRARWRRDPLTRAGVAFLVGGLCTVLVFNRHALTHGFFWFLSAPGFALLGVQGGRMLAALLVEHVQGRVWRRCLAPASALLLLLIAASHLPACFRDKETFERPGVAVMATQLDTILGPGACVTSPEESIKPVMLYSRLRWAPPCIWPGPIRELLAALDGGQASFERLVVILKTTSVQRWPDFFAFLRRLAAERGVRPRSLGDILSYTFKARPR